MDIARRFCAPRGRLLAVVAAITVVGAWAENGRSSEPLDTLFMKIVTRQPIELADLLKDDDEVPITPTPEGASVNRGAGNQGGDVLLDSGDIYDLTPPTDVRYLIRYDIPDVESLSPFGTQFDAPVALDDPDGLDYLTWSGSFGSSHTSTDLPEPTTGALFALGALALVMRRRRR
ncbi:MAG: PEP-CTERM sorting domain-containing protein [Pirellulales bacterium]